MTMQPSRNGRHPCHQDTDQDSRLWMRRPHSSERSPLLPQIHEPTTTLSPPPSSSPDPRTLAAAADHGRDMALQPELMDDAIAEVLLRLPPDEPKHLFRASLVCRTWLRIITDPFFPRRYRAFHGAPPLLGLLHRFRDRHCLPVPDIDCMESSGTVFCAANGCDHLDCHGGPFGVAFIIEGFNDADEGVESSPGLWAMVYSSETRTWMQPRRVNDVSIDRKHGCPALIGDEIYFPLVSTIVDNDSSLGLAGIEDSKLHLWRRKAIAEGAAEWVQCRVIELETMVPMAGNGNWAHMVGFAEDVGIILGFRVSATDQSEGVIAKRRLCSYCKIGSSAPGITAHFVMLMVTEPSAEARLSRFEDETLEGIALAATHCYESRPRNSEQACLDFATVHSTQCLCSQEKGESSSSSLVLLLLQAFAASFGLQGGRPDNRGDLDPRAQVHGLIWKCSFGLFVSC
ncbi:hypothetical protein EJB05_14406, partial [Eragrostis curvula]